MRDDERHAQLGGKRMEKVEQGHGVRPARHREHRRAGAGEQARRADVGGEALG